MVNLIADYLSGGVWMHQAFQMFGTDNEQAAAQAAVAKLTMSGCVPLAIHRIYGDYTLQQLSEMNDGAAPHRLIWCDEKRLKAALAKAPVRR